MTETRTQRVDRYVNAFILMAFTHQEPLEAEELRRAAKPYGNILNLFDVADYALGVLTPERYAENHRAVSAAQ